MSTLTVYEEYLKFPMSSDEEILFNNLVRLLGSVERVEECFQIEFYIDDGDSEISLDIPPRYFESEECLVKGKSYRFTIKQIGDDDGELKYFIDNKLRFTEDFY